MLLQCGGGVEAGRNSSTRWARIANVLHFSQTSKFHSFLNFQKIYLLLSPTYKGPKFRDHFGLPRMKKITVQWLALPKS